MGTPWGLLRASGSRFGQTARYQPDLEDTGRIGRRILIDNRMISYFAMYRRQTADFPPRIRATASREGGEDIACQGISEYRWPPRFDKIVNEISQCRADRLVAGPREGHGWNSRIRARSAKTLPLPGISLTADGFLSDKGKEKRIDYRERGPS